MKKSLMILFAIFNFLVFNSHVKTSGESPKKTEALVSNGLWLNAESLNKSVITDIISNESVLRSRYFNQITEDILTFYSQKKQPLFWQGNVYLSPVFIEAYNQMLSAEEHGLNPSNYISETLSDIYDDVPSGVLYPEDFRNVEINMMAGYLLLNYDLIQGRINPEELSGYWKRDEKGIDIPDKLYSINTPDELKKHFETILPGSWEYSALQKQLVLYREMAQSGGWPTIDLLETKSIKPDSAHISIPTIRRRLLLTDPQLAMSNHLLLADFIKQDSLRYDLSLQQAIERFQKSHGLIVDGVIGKSTVKALNVSARQKAAKIALNMERMRWLPKKYGEHHIKINIPEFKLRVFDGDKKAMEMRVIVGKEYSSTPVFSDTLEYLVMSPTWTVPMSIKTKEMLPKLRKEPAYYTKRNYKFYRGWNVTNEVKPDSIDWSEYNASRFPFNVVQQPGPTNSLGLVKFIMPNDMSIYLHDTPTDYLFDRTQRAFSHGCIRLDRPKDLAVYLLRNYEDWSEEKVSEHLSKPEPTKVMLKEDYHVQLTYQTTFIDETGRINFREDIYDHDKDQLEEIKNLDEQLKTR